MKSIFIHNLNKEATIFVQDAKTKQVYLHEKTKFNWIHFPEIHKKTKLVVNVKTDGGKPVQVETKDIEIDIHL